ncbi:MAG TPA: hypothetical protein VJY62_07825 [Bacteroidia bacterium]|nr:hypothetical protein [Bacteroidia bacterium]
MEDFKILFYVAVAIAWFVYKNYQKVQQNRPGTNVPPKAQPVSTVTEKKTGEFATEKAPRQKQIIIEKQTGFKKEFQANKKSQEAKPVLKDEIIKKTPRAVPFLNVDAFHPAAPEKKIVETNMVTKEFAEEDLFDLKKFDIRTAIIYSEILKRPYD